MNTSDRRGILLIGHGTRNDAGTAEFFLLAQRLRDAMPASVVEAAFLELREPSVAQAWRRLVDRQVTQVDAVPLLLFAAGHAKRDIPTALAACAGATPQIPLRITRPLSRQRSMLALAGARVAEGLRRATEARVAPTADARAALVVVGRGNNDPCAHTDLRLFVAALDRSLHGRLPLAKVVGAFYAMAQPRLPEVLAHLSALGSIDTVVVLPLLLFEGQVKAAIAGQIRQARQDHPALRFHLAEHLGPHPLVVQAVLGRLQELSPVASPCCCT